MASPIIPVGPIPQVELVIPAAGQTPRQNSGSGDSQVFPSARSHRTRAGACVVGGVRCTRGKGNAIAGELALCCGIISFMIALNAHYDGNVIVPDEPLDLPATRRSAS